ncbi:predicted protein [Sclerotinia sclerotiorum 1980 UF-70]|uniref:Clock-controlled protein 6 n=2 Tax=Sclerotinia sclerotiorum (strain ATCC 18683 / 1980 / Ss-1) TaxID=665079 RepID=A0A1D9QB43_SCLS1|nr:predicted protein [Sclerotinia sclerotiorum 1980 UF-70]APA12180.1 hypothetical protein sscle_09g069500 [Sclerotinia sclerotiorum 1980 UF-70]EDN94961.1 predicted protein [Sclerotinia sclerotiorum 1980 UF-70]
MQFSTVAIISALAASVAATGNSSAPANATMPVVWVTDVVTAFTTVCPMATTLSFNGVTYTATESETVTITNCPCTVSKPVYTTSSVICNDCTAAPTAPASSAPVSSGPAYGNSTAPAPTTPVTGAGSVGTSSPSEPSATPSGPLTINTNNGNRVMAFSGASIAGFLAAAAFIL